jgi:hypothetical protein
MRMLHHDRNKRSLLQAAAYSAAMLVERMIGVLGIEQRHGEMIRMGLPAPVRIETRKSRHVLSNYTVSGSCSRLSREHLNEPVSVLFVCACSSDILENSMNPSSPCILIRTPCLVHQLPVSFPQTFRRRQDNSRGDLLTTPSQTWYIGRRHRSYC